MLGVSSPYEQIEPRRLIKSKKYFQLALGGTFTLALSREGGTLYGWGKNFAGKSESLEPVVIDSSVEYTKVAAGNSHAAIIDKAGMLYTWGNGGSWYKGGGQLGNETLKYIFNQMNQTNDL